MNSVCDITRPDVPCAVTATGPPLLPIILLVLFITAVLAAGLYIAIRATRKK